MLKEVIAALVTRSIVSSLQLAQHGMNININKIEKTLKNLNHQTITEIKYETKSCELKATKINSRKITFYKEKKENESLNCGTRKWDIQMKLF